MSEEVGRASVRVVGWVSEEVGRAAVRVVGWVSEEVGRASVRVVGWVSEEGMQCVCVGGGVVHFDYSS